MDGVLISSREAIAAAWSRVAGEQGVALGPDCLRDHVHGRPGGYTLTICSATCRWSAGGSSSNGSMRWRKAPTVPCCPASPR